uniref:Uncharacterized protein n=1 Tax=Cacopsylla melanoneura TaxID=428564 RepID=A0A8D9EI88_9HEMI
MTLVDPCVRSFIEIGKSFIISIGFRIRFLRYISKFLRYIILYLSNTLSKLCENIFSYTISVLILKHFLLHSKEPFVTIVTFEEQMNENSFKVLLTVNSGLRPFLA